jgi:hypothetical protein
LEIFDQCLVIDALQTDSPQNANGSKGRTPANLSAQFFIETLITSVQTDTITAVSKVEPRTVIRVVLAAEEA